MSDEKLHDALSRLGSDLPEPVAPDSLRRSIAGAAPAAHAPRPWRSAFVATLGALAALLALTTTLALVHNGQLRRELALARDQLRGSDSPAAPGVPPLVAVSFFHELCPVAGAVAPRFEAMKREHSADPVLFLTVDVAQAEQAAKLVEVLGCGFIYSCPDAPASSGTVMLADTRSREVIKCCVGAEGLDEVEQALDDAIVRCAQPGD